MLDDKTSSKVKAHTTYTRTYTLRSIKIYIKLYLLIIIHNIHSTVLSLCCIIIFTSYTSPVTCKVYWGINRWIDLYFKIKKNFHVHHIFLLYIRQYFDILFSTYRLLLYRYRHDLVILWIKLWIHLPKNTL